MPVDKFWDSAVHYQLRYTISQVVSVLIGELHSLAEYQEVLTGSKHQPRAHGRRPSVPKQPFDRRHPGVNMDALVPVEYLFPQPP